MDRLQPERYVLATSVGLSPGNKETLIEALAPWCASPADIYGPTELNALLRDYPEIERAHFKLWVSSTAILERILHARIFNITEATVGAAQAQLSRVVMHGGFDRALDILRDEHHVLIVGNPGIGKTTLARMLLCHYLREDFEPVCVVGNIDEAWDLVHGSLAVTRKTVILYDDFLGRFRFDAQRFGKNEEHSLFEFLDKVRRSPNLRFVMTTREYIMADARRVHGAFDERAGQILKCTLTLADYSQAHKAKMLFNHLYFSDLPDSRLAALVHSKAYSTIVNHTHFNPRIVENISTYANSKALTDREYLKFIQQEFDNPSKLWEHPFRNDIGPVARNVLAVLWTFGGKVSLDVLKASVLQVLAQEHCKNAPFLFTEALRQLDGNFILTNRYPRISTEEEPVHVAQFQNPSVEEFMDSVLTQDPQWVEQLAGSVVTFRQVYRLASHAHNKNTKIQFSTQFWSSLRSAVSVIKFPDGRVINYRRNGGEAEEVWENDSFLEARKVLTRLNIESHIRLRDAQFESLQAQVLTCDGWLGLIGKFSSDHSVVWVARELHSWVMEKSGWASEEKLTCQNAFREALMSLLADEDEIWMASIASLRVFADVLVSFGRPLKKQERNRFAAAAKIVQKTIEDNSDDVDEIQGEADELDALGKTCGFDVKTQAASLRSHADYVLDQQAEREMADPESRSYTSPASEESLDIDSLFTGLLDR